jgi:hypothetical protein
MTSSDIRARVDSFWLNSLEAELLACVAHALAEIADSLEDIRKLLRPVPATSTSADTATPPSPGSSSRRDAA